MSNTDYLFMCLFAIHLSSLKCSLKSLAQLKNQEFFFKLHEFFIFSRWLLLLFSCSKLCPTLSPHGLQHCQALLSFTVSQSLLQFMSIELMILASQSHPLLSPSPAFSLSQHQDCFEWVGSLHQVARELELHCHSFQWIFRIDLLWRSPSDSSITEHWFCFGPCASFFLEPLVIALCSSPVAY